MKLNLVYVTNVASKGQAGQEAIVARTKTLTEKKINDIKTYCKQLPIVVANKYHAALVL
jgi:hypothetical protein